MEQFENGIKKHSLVNEEMKNIIDGFPKTAHPMGVLSALTSALTAFNPKAVNVDNEKEMYEAICKTMAKFLSNCYLDIQKINGLSFELL